MQYLTILQDNIWYISDQNRALLAPKRAILGNRCQKTACRGLAAEQPNRHLLENQRYGLTSGHWKVMILLSRVQFCAFLGNVMKFKAFLCILMHFYAFLCIFSAEFLKMKSWLYRFQDVWLYGCSVVWHIYLHSLTSILQANKRSAINGCYKICIPVLQRTVVTVSSSWLQRRKCVTLQTSPIKSAMPWIVSTVSCSMPGRLSANDLTAEVVAVGGRNFFARLEFLRLRLVVPL